MASGTGLPNQTLRPRARILRTLGQELISSEVVAVIELVKNAYDADATRVLIQFVPPLVAGAGRIDVIDNGHGMSLEAVRTVWMELATVSKRDKRRSPRLNRRYLGEKGIGRFASARLAEELEVISRLEGSKTEVFAVFDWRQFDDDSRFLDEIQVLWEERPAGEVSPAGSLKALWNDAADTPAPEELNHGTILRMSSLRQTWGRKQFEDLTRGLSRLVAPRKGKGLKGDSGFEISLRLPSEFADFNEKIEPPAILKYPHYTITGSVKPDGQFEVEYHAKAAGVDQVARGTFARVPDKKGALELRALQENAALPEETERITCGPLEFELQVWDRDELGNVVQRTDSVLADVRRDLDAVAGVNLYRDGFRVLPYGEPQDDWLRLDLRRVQNPTLRLSNNQIHGVVRISADANPNLRDQSNREGLDDNQALRDLRGVLIHVLVGLENIRWESRRSGGSTAARTAGGLFSGLDFKALASELSRETGGNKEVMKIVKRTESAFDSQLKEIQTVLARYQRLATLGQLIDHVLHEGRQPITAINNEAYLGLADAKRLSDAHATVAPLVGRFALIRKQGDILSLAFKRMEPFGGRRRGRPAQLYLEDIVKDAVAVFSSDLDRLGVKVFLPKTQTLVRVDPAEMQEVIINLMQNSLHWLDQVPTKAREIRIQVDRKGPNDVQIVFADSGPGVPTKNRDLIFEPYFTTKPNGVGLGLAIAGEIVSDYYNGSLELLASGPLKGANFLITLRKRV